LSTAGDRGDRMKDKMTISNFSKDVSYITVALGILISCPAFSAPRLAATYSITDLGVIVPKDCRGAEFINARGQILGFGITPKEKSIKGFSAIVDKEHRGVLDLGDTGGKARPTGWMGYEYIWDKGKIRILGHFVAQGFNDKGQVVGLPVSGGG